MKQNQAVIFTDDTKDIQLRIDVSGYYVVIGFVTPYNYKSFKMPPALANEVARVINLMADMAAGDRPQEVKNAD